MLRTNIKRANQPQTRADSVPRTCRQGKKMFRRVIVEYDKQIEEDVEKKNACFAGHIWSRKLSVKKNSMPA